MLWARGVEGHDTCKPKPEGGLLPKVTLYFFADRQPTKRVDRATRAPERFRLRDTEFIQTETMWAMWAMCHECQSADTESEVPDILSVTRRCVLRDTENPAADQDLVSVRQVSSNISKKLGATACIFGYFY